MLSTRATTDNDQNPDSAAQTTPSPTSSDGWTSSATFSDPGPAAALTRRPVLAYPEAIAKGFRLLNYISKPSDIRSVSSSSANLREWGYITTSKTILPGHPFHSAFETLNPGCIIHAKEVSSTHITKSTTPSGTVIPPTAAMFVNGFDFEHGVLVAGSNFGPAFASHNKVMQDGEALPELRHWSDVVYLQAKFLASDERRVPEGSVRPSADAIKGLRAVVRMGIENRDTNAIVHGILQHELGGACTFPLRIDDAGCPGCCKKIPWPGLTFDTSSQEGQALLGTPNGSGVVWLLKQHDELASKTIARVTVWCDTTKKSLTPSLVFWIEDGGPAIGERSV
ncbi:hypothetical protein OPT61_g7266 [Boeremia exigua]|uniref:Uncharacterized protein n=1 Tax=Boeremia exigua TaxID=749465 RepID=A0ACC2I408_9PLEO|nr:hypothetical protein OPT61_g7266 [Boeremia exigua]